MAVSVTTELRDVMTRDVEACAPDAVLRDAAEIMRRLDVGIVPVCAGRRLEGVITDRDITIRGLADDRDPLRTRVSDIMSRDVITCFEDQPVTDAARLMKDKQIRRLMICDHGGELVGVLSLGDLAVDTADERMVGEVLRSVSEPVRPQS